MPGAPETDFDFLHGNFISRTLGLGLVPQRFDKRLRLLDMPRFSIGEDRYPLGARPLPALVAPKPLAGMFGDVLFEAADIILGIHLDIFFKIVRPEKCKRRLKKKRRDENFPFSSKEQERSLRHISWQAPRVLEEKW